MNNTEPSGFRRVIQHIPNDSSVLDVGGGGLHGVNTTNYLLEHFGAKNVTCICSSTKEVETFKAQLDEAKREKPKFINGDFYKQDWTDKYDVVVLDLNIENNLKDWSDEGFERIKKLLKPNGILITYIMMTELYGSEDTGRLILEHWKKYWKVEKLTHEVIGRRLKKIDGFSVYEFDQEEMRPYILWVALKLGS